MSDSSAVDVAVFTALRADATLTSLAPDGVWPDVAPQKLTQFVIVSQPTHEDTYEENREAFERFTYLVKAVIKTTSTTIANQAESRIRAAVEGITTITGYRRINMQRTERVAYTEVDPDNPDAHWQHRGGLFELLVEPV